MGTNQDVEERRASRLSFVQTIILYYYFQHQIEWRLQNLRPGLEEKFDSKMEKEAHIRHADHIIVGLEKSFERNSSTFIKQTLSFIWKTSPKFVFDASICGISLARLYRLSNFRKFYLLFVRLPIQNSFKSIEKSWYIQLLLSVEFAYVH